MNRLQALHDAGVSIWLDTLSRNLLERGEFATLVDQFAVSGATSNPTIFASAIRESDSYDDQLRSRISAGATDASELFFTVALDDVRRAAAILRPIHDRTQGRDGFVSFECTPDLANDTEATIAQARDLWQRLDLPNVLIKVPATRAGVSAIEELIAAGVNINATLLLSVERYGEVIDAYLRGLERRVAAGEAIAGIVSVASFFVSRVDTKADALLPTESPLRGRLAIANAQLAYRVYLQRFSGRRWDALREAGATAQRPLWASTGTRDPRYSDVLYVEQLIGRGEINTMPQSTLRAFAEHGSVDQTLDPRLDAPKAVLSAGAAEGLDMAAITSELEHEGVNAFCDSYEQLLSCLEDKVTSLAEAAR